MPGYQAAAAYSPRHNVVATVADPRPGIGDGCGKSAFSLAGKSF